MTKVVYFAGPIRAVNLARYGTDPRMLKHAEDYAWWRDNVTRRLAQEQDVIVYTPWSAFYGTDDAPPQIVAVNDTALVHADLVLAVRHEAFTSPGTERELEIARSLGIDIFGQILDNEALPVFDWLAFNAALDQAVGGKRVVDDLMEVGRTMNEEQSHLLPQVLEQHRLVWHSAHPDFGLSKVYELDAGWDIATLQDAVIPPGQSTTLATGIKVAIAPGYYGRVVSRSSVALRHLTVLSGVIDSGYRGEIVLHMTNVGSEPERVAQGERLAQLIVTPVGAIWSTRVEDEDLLPPPLDGRNTAGWGSTGD